VKYVKRNAIAGRRFESFAALEAYLAEWMSRGAVGDPAGAPKLIHPGAGKVIHP
jgi:hypothetical protein